ncbi:hypothetical protein ABID21_004820 [Pseudorhizobium tarimense]|uniref:Uncharacterized protein n=1 Tax=Pseudorhizobium tarimense TaxID=1079109 RepID=A0ABV2HEN9_9HYPH
MVAVRHERQMPMILCKLRLGPMIRQCGNWKASGRACNEEAGRSQ